MARLAVLLVTLAGAAALAGAARGDVTIGQTHVPNRSCGHFLVVQTSVDTGTSFTVPPGSWRVTGWSFQTIAVALGPVAAVFLRPEGGHSYTVVGSSAVETPPASALSTYPASIPVRGGDLLALWSGAGLVACSVVGGPGDSYDIAIADTVPAPGDVLPALTSASGDRLDISATLAPAEAPESHEFVCYSKWEQDGGQVVGASTADALVAAGEWRPVALPGNVPGGDNLGAYHLACNPPSSATPTGQSVGDGGDVLDGWQDGYYAIDTLGG